MTFSFSHPSDEPLPAPTTIWQSLVFFLNRPQGFWVFLTITLVLQLLLRGFGSDSLGRDALEEAIYSQHWAWGYNPRQPPLYTWLLSLFKFVFGSSIWAYQLLKFCLVFCGFGSLYLCACQLIPNRLYASFAALTPGLTFVFGFETFQFYTHSLVFMACCGLTLWACIRFSNKNTLFNACLLGIIIGLGFLSKYSYPIVICGLCLSLLTSTQLRRSFYTPLGLVSCLIAVLICLPHILWLLDHPGQLSHAISYTLTEQTNTGYIEDITKALSKFLASSFNFIAIPFILILLCFAAPLHLPYIPKRPITEWMRHVTREQASTETYTSHSINFAIFSAQWQTILFRFILLNIIAAVGMILIFGVTRIQSHHLIGPFLWFPLPLFSWLYAKRLQAGGSPMIFASVLVICQGLFFIALSIMLVTDVDGRECRRCYLQRPTSDLANTLIDRGFVAGTIVTHHQLLAGGMARAFPDSQIYTKIYPHYLPDNTRPDTRSQGACLLLWEGTESGKYQSLRAWTQTNLLSTLPDAPIIETISLPYLYSHSARRFSVSYALLPANGQCH